MPGEAGRFGGVDCVDSVEDDAEAVVDEWAADRFEVVGVDYRLEWLRDAEAEVIWARYGWG